MDDHTAIEKKITHAVTDSIREFYYDEKERPGLSGLIRLYLLFADDHKGEGIEIQSALSKKYADGSFSKFKSDLIHMISTKLTPIRTRYEALIKNSDYLDEVLKHGSSIAEQIAEYNFQQYRSFFN